MSKLLRRLTNIGIFATALACGLEPAVADAVMDWNKVAIDAVVASKQTAPMTTRSMAMVHAAIFDAVNAVDRRYAFYRSRVSAPANASTDVAASAAAHAVLLALFPVQKVPLDAAYAPTAALLADDPSAAAGSRVGEQVAAEIVAWRAKDGTGGPNTYRPKTTPGVYVPTALPIAYDVARSTPWLMDRPDQFRPGPPPSLASATWTRDYDEIKSLGGKASSVRTPEQTIIARFWIQTGATSWNPIVRQFATRTKQSEVDEARLFAMIYLAAADTLVAVFDAKYTYDFWRPITAIRNGDNDGNPQTTPDPAWMPLAETPMHPEYPCAHCINASAVGAVLESAFGAGSVPSFTMTSPTAPGVTRQWSTFSDYVDEVSNSRIWAGLHYRTSTEVAKTMGRRIAALAIKRFAPRELTSSKD